MNSTAALFWALCADRDILNDNMCARVPSHWPLGATLGAGQHPVQNPRQPLVEKESLVAADSACAMEPFWPNNVVAS